MKRRPYIELILILLSWLLLLAIDLFGATITSNGTGGGSFRKGATWVGGTPPADGDLTVIAAGDSVWFNADVDTNFTIGNDGTGDLDISGKLTCINSGEIDTLFMKGGISVNNGGSFIIDKSSDGTDYFIIIMDCSSDGEHGIVIDDGGIIDWDGEAKLYATYLDDGDAAATDTDITVAGDITGWQVGDELVIEGDVAGETEKVTINSIASQVVDITGTALVSQHDSARKVVNITRNVKFTSANASYDTYIKNQTTTKANFDIQYCELSNLYSGANKYGLYNNGAATVEYCAFHDGATAYFSDKAKTDYVDFNYNICYNFSSYAVYLRYTIRGTQTNNYLFDCQEALALFSVTSINIDNNYICDGGNGIRLGGRQQISLSANDITLRTNTTDINNTSSDSYLDMIFDDCSASSGTFISGMSNAIYGSKLRFSRFNSNNDDYRSYEVFGTVRSTGTGLADTFVRTANSLALKMTPNDASDALGWEFAVPADSGSPLAVAGYLYCTDRPVAASDDIEPSISISGCGMTEDTYSFTIETDESEDTWILWTVSGTPTRSGLATVTVSCYDFSATNPDVYLDDMVTVSTAFNLGELDIWYRGLPAPIILATGLGALDIWKVVRSINFGDGSMGEGVKNIIRRTPK